MTIINFFTATAIGKLVTAALIIFAALLVASFLIHHTMAQAFKGLKLALKSEVKSTVGRVNALAMILFVLLIITFRLDETLTQALSVEPASGTSSSPTTITILAGILFMGSLICVMFVEKE